ncbi:MAG: hypothetical protein WC812_00150 [Candidatus Pacearchaeota archaeon]|jgi:hypothetical protein
MNLDEKAIFFESHSDESKKAKKLLDKNNLNFVSIYISNYEKPILISSDSAYSFKGISSIKSHIKFLFNFKKCL